MQHAPAAMTDVAPLATNAYLSSLVPNTSPDQWESTLSFFSSINADSGDSSSAVLPHDVLNAIAALLHAVCRSEILSAPHKLMRLEIEHECSMDSLTAKFTDAQSKINKLQADHDNLADINQSLHSQISTVNTQLHRVEEQRNQATRQLSEVNLQVDSLTQRNRELLKATGQQDRLEAFQNDEYQKILTKFTDVRTEVDKIRAECVDLTVKLTSTEFAKDRAEQQLRIAQTHMEWLTNELSRIQTESGKIVKDRSHQITQLLNQINSLEQEKLYLDKTSSDMLAKLQSAQHNLVEARAKVVTLESEIQTNEQAFKHEVSRWQEYGNLQAGLAKAARDQADRRDVQIKDAKLASQIARDNLADLQRSLEDAQLQFTAERQDLKDKIAELQNRIEMIDKVNSDLQEVAGQSATGQAFPNGSLAVTALRSGMTYSQLWAELVTKENTIMHLQHRADDLEDGLVTIVKEMEDHAPVYTRITVENDELRELVRGLNVQIVSAEREKSGILAQCQIWKDRVTAAEEELDQQKILTSDMAQQLAHLLAGMNAEDVLNELRSLLIESAPGQPGNQAITEHLVEFDDVQALVAKNHELLVAVRRLAEKLDELSQKVQADPSETLDSVIQERNNLEIQLEVLRQQVQDKALEDENDHHTSDEDSNDVNSEINEGGHSIDTEVRLKHQQTVIDTLQAKLHEADDRNVNLTMSTARSEALNKLITDDLDRSRATITSLRDQVQTLTAHCQSHSRTITQLEERIMVMDSELSGVRSMLEIERRNHVATQSAKAVFEQTAASVDKHLAQVTAQRDMFQGMIQDMQSMAERQSTESSNAAHAARQRIDVLEAQAVSLANKLEAARENENRLVQQYAKDLRDIHAQQVNQAGVQNRATNVGDIHPVSASNAEPAGSMSIPEQSNLGSWIDNDAKIKELEGDIEFLSSEVRQREARIEEAFKHSSIIEADLTLVQQELITVKNALKESEDNKVKAERAAEELDIKCKSISADLETSNRVRNETQVKYDDLLKKSEELSSQLKSLQTNLDKAEDRYCHELQSHAADLTLLEQIKEERLDFQNQLRHLESQLDAAETSRVTEVNSLSTRISGLNLEISQLQSQLENLRAQNAKLFDQVTDSSAPSNPNTDEVRDLLSLIRKERDALMLDRETSVLEANRKLAHLERTNQTLRMQLESAEAQLAQGSQIHDLKTKLNEQTRQVALFRESNETLRNERQRLEQMNNTLSGELNGLRERVQALRVREVDLEGELAAVRSQAAKYQHDAKDWQLKCTQLPAANPIDPERHAALEVRVADLEEALASKEKEVLQARMRNTELAKRNNERVGLIREYKAKEEMAKLEVEALMRAKDENSGLVSRMSSDIADLNLKLAALESEKKSIIQRANQALHAASSSASPGQRPVPIEPAQSPESARASAIQSCSPSDVLSMPVPLAEGPPVPDSRQDQNNLHVPRAATPRPPAAPISAPLSSAATPMLSASAPLHTSAPLPTSAPPQPLTIDSHPINTNPSSGQSSAPSGAVPSLPTSQLLARNTTVPAQNLISGGPSLKRPLPSNDTTNAIGNGQPKRLRPQPVHNTPELAQRAPIHAQDPPFQGQSTATGSSPIASSSPIIPSIEELQASAHAELAKRRANISSKTAAAALTQNNQTTQVAQVPISQPIPAKSKDPPLVSIEPRPPSTPVIPPSTPVPVPAALNQAVPGMRAPNPPSASFDSAKLSLPTRPGPSPVPPASASLQQPLITKLVVTPAPVAPISLQQPLPTKPVLTPAPVAVSNAHHPLPTNPSGLANANLPDKPTPQPRSMPNPSPELAALRAKLLASKRAMAPATPRPAVPSAPPQHLNTAAAPFVPAVPTNAGNISNAQVLPPDADRSKVTNAEVPAGNHPPSQPDVTHWNNTPVSTPLQPSGTGTQDRAARPVNEVQQVGGSSLDLATVSPPTSETGPTSTESVSEMSESSSSQQSSSQFQFIPIAFNPSPVLPPNPNVTDSAPVAANPVTSLASAPIQQAPNLTTPAAPTCLPVQEPVVNPSAAAVPTTAPVGRGRRGRGRGSLPVVPGRRGGGRGF